MTVIEVSDKIQWNNFLLSQHTQAGIFLQSWEWGEFQQAMGRKVYRLVHGSQTTVHGFAQIIEKPLPFGKKYWYIPRGMMIDAIEEEARKQGILFLRFEPITGERLPEVTGGYRRLQEVASVQPKQTLILDLFKSEEELLAGMHEKTRYNIKLAQRKGVVHSSRTTVHSFEEFWKLMRETAKRDKFRTHSREYYEKMLDALNNPSQPPLNLRGGEGGVMSARLWIAHHDTAPIACAIVGYFGDTAIYLHGASSYEHRALMGPHALHWDIIKDAKKQGYKYYDFWGIQSSSQSSVHSSQKSWAGITRFKMGFNGKVVDYPGAFDLPLSKFWYKVYRLGRRLLP